MWASLTKGKAAVIAEVAAGWPIASGPVEDACKNLIKDRMGEDLDRYSSFHLHTDQDRLHPLPNRRPYLPLSRLADETASGRSSTVPNTPPGRPPPAGA